jgi:photosystem II stability/assembly factor-like uncharacterized protein
MDISPQSTNKMNTVGFATNNFTGWAFGDSIIGLNFQYGVIYKTTSQGFSWVEQDMSSDSIQINDCYVFSNQEVIGVGKFQTTGEGAFIRTTDGGLTWIKDTTSIPERLFDVDFVNATNGWTVGRNGYIGMTNNSGVSWSPQTSGTGEDLFGISFADQLNGWAVGADGGNGGEILHTTDGGLNWTSQTNSVQEDLFAVNAISSTEAVAVGQGGIILYTSDSGLNWNAQTSGTGNNLFDVIFSDASNGRAVGGTGTIVVTSDAGTTWTSEVSNTTNDINDLFEGQNNISWFGGDNGGVYIFSTQLPNGLDESQLLDVVLYPNPTSSTFLIKGELITGMEITVSDLTGKKLIYDEIDGLKEFDMTHCEPGTYIYVISTDGQINAIGKIIKK